MNDPAIDMRDRVVLVTGGTRGTGRGIAQRFTDAGARVVVAARRTVEGLPAEWEFESADLRDAGQATTLVDTIVARHGRIDVVVNNAGGAPLVDTSTASASLTERVVALNLLSAIYVAQAANAHMQSQEGGGAIVNIGSVCALRPSPSAAAYGAAKAGLLNYTMTAAQEWAPKVRVNYITASLIRTEDTELYYGGADAVARIEATIPVGAMATPAQIGDVCLFLASPLAAYVTGANVAMHGGGERPTFLTAL